MSSSSIIALAGWFAITVVLVLAVIAIFDKRWNSEIAFVLGALAITAIVAIGVPLINPDVSLAYLLPQMAGTVISGLVLAGGIRLVRSRHGDPEPGPLPPENPFSRERFSFERVFKAYLVILAVAILVFALWVWWFVATT